MTRLWLLGANPIVVLHCLKKSKWLGKWSKAKMMVLVSAAVASYILPWSLERAEKIGARCARCGINLKAYNVCIPRPVDGICQDWTKKTRLYLVIVIWQNTVTAKRIRRRSLSNSSERSAWRSSTALQLDINSTEKLAAVAEDSLNAGAVHKYMYDLYL